MSTVSLYASVGAQLAHYDVDVEEGSLTRRDMVGLLANVRNCSTALKHRCAA